MRGRIAVTLIPLGLIVTAFLIYLALGVVLAVGWLLFVALALVGGRLLADEREQRRREERELIERALRVNGDPWDSLPDRCHEAPDPYRKEAA